MHSHKFNAGWRLALGGWVLSSVLVPFLPELMSGGQILGYPLMEYAATIGLFAVILLVVWIPAGKRASRLYRAYGLRRAVYAQLKVFAVQLLVFAVIFRFFWNS